MGISSKKMPGIAGDRIAVVIVRWDDECLIPSSAELKYICWQILLCVLSVKKWRGKVKAVV